MSPSMKSSMLGYTLTEASSSDAEPRTPLRHIESRNPRADTETSSIQGARRESRLSTLRVDTHVSESLQSGSRRVSPSESTDDSPASSTSAHSRQDSTASYTPLRSARGSLSLGGTAHHSRLSRRCSLSQSSIISREALALPLADTDTLILVPDAVANRSPLCTQTNAECTEVSETQTRQRRSSSRRRRKCRRYVEIRNTSIMTGILCVLLIVALSMYVAMAIPRVNDIPTSVHVCIIGTFVVVAGFILLFSIRLHKAINRYKDKSEDADVRDSRWRAGHPTEAEQSLIPNSPIMVQYEADDEDVERALQESPAIVRPPPPAYGRWRGSYRMDPELLHWRRVGDVEDGQRSSVDTAPPMYASPLRPTLTRQDEAVGATEMVEVGRAC